MKTIEDEAQDLYLKIGEFLEGLEGVVNKTLFTALLSHLANVIAQVVERKDVEAFLQETIPTLKQVISFYYDDYESIEKGEALKETS